MKLGCRSSIADLSRSATVVGMPERSTKRIAGSARSKRYSSTPRTITGCRALAIHSVASTRAAASVLRHIQDGRGGRQLLKHLELRVVAAHLVVDQRVALPLAETRRAADDEDR